MFKKGLLFLMTLFFVACGSTPTAAPPTATVVATNTPLPPPPTVAVVNTGKIQKACLVVMSAGLTPGTFNHYANEGMLAIAKDYGLETKHFILEQTDSSDASQKIEQCVTTEKAQVVIATGFPLGEATLNAAKQFPEVYFIGVDHFVQDGPKNYVGIQFREDEAGFLVGYLAGLVTKSNVVGGVYGPPYPALKKFRHGYEQGVAFAAKEFNKKIETLGEHTQDFVNVQEGEAFAKKLIEAKADVLFFAAGGAGTGGMLYAVDQQVYAIGVDQDEYFTTFESGKKEGAKYLISSALKHVDVGVYDMLAALVEDDMTKFQGGGNYILNISNGGITYATKHEADLPDELYQKIAKLSERLASGELVTGVDPNTGELKP